MTARFPHLIARAASRFVSALAILLAGAAPLLVVATPARSATVIGSIQDVTGAAYGGQFGFLQFNPLSTPQRIGTNTVWDIPRPARMVNGLFSIQLVGGYYNVSAGLPNKIIKILVPPNDTNVWQFNDCANLATNLGTFVWTNVPFSGFTGTLTNLAISRLLLTTNAPPGVMVTGAGIALANGFYAKSGGSYIAGNQYYIQATFCWPAYSYPNVAWQLFDAGGNSIYQQTNGVNLAGFSLPVTNPWTLNINGIMPNPTVIMATNMIITTVLTNNFNIIAFTNGICATNVLQ